MQKIKKYIKNTDKPIAMVFGLDFINTLGVVRSLGRRSIPVIEFDPNLKRIGFFSRYCKRIVCPDPTKQEEEFVNLLLIIGEMMNTKGVVIQTEEASISTILKHKNELRKYYEIPMANLDIIEKLTNKGKFYKMLKKLDLPHPKTYFPTDISDVEKISKEITYPYIVKPEFSLSFGKDFHVKVFKANSAKELVMAYNKATSSGHEVVIQEVIPGSDTNVYGLGSYVNYKSEPIGIFIYKKIRGYPKGFGTCNFVESVWEPEVFKLGTQLIQNINYHGISEIEFKKDLRDDKFKIIEVNARTWWQNRLAARCGVDVSYMAYMDAIGKDAKKIISKKEGVKWLYMSNDLRSSFESMSKGELSFTEWINSLRGEKEYATFAWDDPVPFFVSLFNLSSALLRRLL